MKPLLLLATLFFTTCAAAEVGKDAGNADPAARFGADIARALNARDAEAMAQLIDFHSLGQRAAGLQGMNSVNEAAFAHGVEIGGSKMIAGLLKSVDASQGKAQFMRVTNVRPPRALVRLDLGTSGFDYLEYIIETNAGQTRAVDWFQLSSGQLFSDTMGRVAQLFTTDDPSLVGRLFGTKSVDRTAIDNLRKIGELQRAGRYADALQAYRALPEPIANSRIMLTAQASMALLAKRNEDYDRILTKLAEKYSDDPATAFMLIDHYFVRKDLPNLLKSLDTMERRVGIDGVTRHLRASAYYVTSDYTTCVKYADEAIRLEPERMPGYDLRASALLALERFPEAVAQYREMAKQFDLHFTRALFASDPQYAKFVASPAFQKWLPK